MVFIFRNRTIFWDIPKWNRGQTKWDGGSTILLIMDTHAWEKKLTIFYRIENNILNFPILFRWKTFSTSKCTSMENKSNRAKKHFSVSK